MMQFCGHDPICRKFNNLEALQKAKANVEKHYPVVGITENINMTLGELHNTSQCAEGDLNKTSKTFTETLTALVLMA